MSQAGRMNGQAQVGRRDFVAGQMNATTSFNRR